MNEFEHQLYLYRTTIEHALDAELPSTRGLSDVVRYSALGGGKRLRGALVLAFAGEPTAAAVRLACAVELLHTYTLVHDDLPCMDNDDLRRGKPSTHKQFGEWRALLSGDALQAYAFKLAAVAGAQCSADTGARCVAILADAAYAVCIGQYLDLSRSDDIEALSFNKTAALFATACELGAVAGSRSTSAAREFGEKIGLAFQIIDDILDEDGYFTAFGELECRRMASELTDSAIAAVSNPFLVRLAQHLLTRAK